MVWRGIVWCCVVLCAISWYGMAWYCVVSSATLLPFAASLTCFPLQMLNCHSKPCSKNHFVLWSKMAQNQILDFKEITILNVYNIYKSTIVVIPTPFLNQNISTCPYGEIHFALLFCWRLLSSRVIFCLDMSSILGRTAFHLTLINLLWTPFCLDQNLPKKFQTGTLFFSSHKCSPFKVFLNRN